MTDMIGKKDEYQVWILYSPKGLSIYSMDTNMIHQQRWEFSIGKQCSPIQN